MLRVFLFSFLLLQTALFGSSISDHISNKIFVGVSIDDSHLFEAIEAKFTEIHILEKDLSTANYIREKCLSYPQVKVHHANLAKQLPSSILKINEPITFWIRGDFDQLITSLDQIKLHPVKTHTLLIDHGKEYEPLIITLTKKMEEINPNYRLQFDKEGTLVALDEHQQVFTHIYDNKVWGTNAQGEGFSGGGSLAQNTQEYMSLLRQFIKDKQIKSVVDAGCGDWEFSRLIDWSGIDYTGYDVVFSVIQKVSEKYSAPNIRFFHGSIINEDLPEADLLICKHVLQHLRNQDILKFLPQIKKFKYCLFTNEVNPSTLSSHNPDIMCGGGHKIDLSKPPFNIPGTKLLTYRIGSAAHQVFLVVNE